MVTKKKKEIKALADRLTSLCRELDIISEALLEDFKGINSGTCSRSIKEVSSHYKAFARNLTNG